MSTPTGKKHVFTKNLDFAFLSVYNGFVFMGRFFREAFRGRMETQEIIKQCYAIGNKSLLLISLTGFITGMVFTKQSRPSLAEFGATSWLPSLVSIAIVRALAALVTALISAGKVGSSIGAELGSMRVTEQIDAMEVSAINPFKYLVVTRVVASTIAIPILMCYCGMVGLAGAFLNVTLTEGTSLQTFIQKAFEQITFLDIGTSLIKGIAYGFTIGIVGCYQGYNAKKGTEGVGKAANSSVVISMFLIFIEEVIIVQVSNYFRV
ncbi:MlaE family ABC transporter permease [Dyadobacter tibetensis]|uniref:MlaE family ABC transporter permease n=1 Tax=Dyadobacter tibetensis TaxID=1211851 RepID=UPI000471EC44|nr:ABC transporter permease [Dyadobacter tibetensis]